MTLETKKNYIERTYSRFNLRAIMRSGQVFRMYEPEDNRFLVFSADRHLEIVVADEEGGTEKLRFFCDEDEFEGYWKHYFDLEYDYDAIHKRIDANAHNSFLKQSASACGDIRILNQDLFEMLITFIISQQKQIPVIRRCVELLCERFGEKKRYGDMEYYAFPTPTAIVSGGEAGLDGLKLGYRARYIYESSVKFIEDNVSKDTFSAMTYAQAKDYLRSFCGVGEKVANCICLFGLHYVSAFPVDTHVKDIIDREFTGKADKQRGEAVGSSGVKSDAWYREQIDSAFAEFDEVKGILQQWMFAYELQQR